MRLNWVDIILVAIILQSLYAGKKSEFIPEIYQFFGALLATFVGLHYFIGFGAYIAKHFWVPSEVQECFAFCLLAGSIVFFFFISKGGWRALLRIYTPDILDKWGSRILSVFRGVLYCGLVFLALAMSDDGIISKDAKTSLTSPVFKNVSIATYGSIFKVIVRPIFRKENFNDKVYHIIATETNEVRKTKSQQ